MVRSFLSYLFTLIVIAASFLGGIVMFVLHNKTVDFSPLAHYDPGKPTILIDDEGNEWARFQLDRREPISIEQIPSHVIGAFLAAEDHRFFQHSGISWKGIVRSTLVNIYHGKKKQGASTITQQLIRLLFFNSKKTFKRKLQEQFYALLAEKQFTKRQLLELYLNHVCFGMGIYGVEAASQRFWGTSVCNLSVAQAATLAGIVQVPARLCPLTHPESSQRRRNIVLSSMKKFGFIAHEEYSLSYKESLNLQESIQGQCAPHLKETIRQLLEDEFGKSQVYTGGLLVQTTLNKRMQFLAQQSFLAKFDQLRKSIASDVDGALISIDVKTGGIKALVGGVDFKQSKWNRAFQARRQMGSIFKPIVYAAALESGKSLADTDVDEQLSIEGATSLWQPKNVTKRFEGEMTLARALAHSNNIVTIKTLLDIGCERVVTLGEKFRIPGLQPYPSIALGCVDVTLEEAVGSFNVFANDGVYVEPHYLVWIKDQWGKKIYRSNPQRERVIDSKISGQVSKVLSIGMERKRKLTPNAWIASEGIGKTGTTNDCRTSWFSGSTPTVTTSLYVGCDDNRSMGKRVYGTTTAFPIWLKLHRSLKSSQNKFVYDASLQEVTINSKTGNPILSRNDPDAYTILI